MGKNLALGFTDIGATNKIQALMTKYNVIKEFNEEAYTSTKNSNKNRTGLWKFMPYELQRSSEYFVQGMEMVAFMLSTNIKTESGESVSLWKAYDQDGNWKGELFEEQTNKDWNGNPNQKEDNTKKYNFKNNLDQILKVTHGNYDPDSAVMIKKTFWGRALMQFRSWVPEGWAARFETEKSDIHMGRRRKGRYRTYSTLGVAKSLTTLAKQIMYKKDAF